MNDVLEALRGVIATNFAVAPEQVTPTASLRAEIGLDSLDLVDLTFFIERHFKFSASPQDYRGLATVGEVVAVIERKLSEASDG